MLATRTSRSTSLLIAALTVLAVTASGCGDRAPAPAERVVEPIPSLPPAPSPEPAALPEPAVADAAPAPPPSAGAGTGEVDSTASRQVVDEVLLRYDAAMTAIGRDPLGATALGDPRSAALAGTVTPSSSLAAEVVRRLVTDAANGMTVDPGPHGLSWSHAVVSASPAIDGRIAFTWCGWSPGIGTGPGGIVLDDGVRISQGTGEAVQHDGEWRLDQLIELEAEVAAPGTPDPCQR